MKDYFNTVHQETLEYLFSLQRIALYKADSGDYFSPYQLEMCRQEMHYKLFQNRILPMLHLVDGFTDEDAYKRSKEIFSHLDEVWKIYDSTEFDMTSDDCIQWLAIYLDKKFLYCTETLYYLEGRTQHINGLSI